MHSRVRGNEGTSLGGGRVVGRRCKVDTDLMGGLVSSVGEGEVRRTEACGVRRRLAVAGPARGLFGTVRLLREESLACGLSAGGECGGATRRLPYPTAVVESTVVTGILLKSYIET